MTGPAAPPLPPLLPGHGVLQVSTLPTEHLQDHSIIINIIIIIIIILLYYTNTILLLHKLLLLLLSLLLLLLLLSLGGACKRPLLGALASAP